MSWPQSAILMTVWMTNFICNSSHFKTPLAPRNCWMGPASGGGLKPSSWTCRVNKTLPSCVQQRLVKKEKKKELSTADPAMTWRICLSGHWERCVPMWSLRVECVAMHLHSKTAEIWDESSYKPRILLHVQPWLCILSSLIVLTWTGWH